MIATMIMTMTATPNCPRLPRAGCNHRQELSTYLKLSCRMKFWGHTQPTRECRSNPEKQVFYRWEPAFSKIGCYCHVLTRAIPGFPFPHCLFLFRPGLSVTADEIHRRRLRHPSFRACSLNAPDNSDQVRGWVVGRAAQCPLCLTSRKY